MACRVTLKRALTLSLSASEWALQSNTECVLQFTLNGQCNNTASECGLWMGFGDDTEYVMLRSNIYSDNSRDHEFRAIPSNDTAASGDVTAYFDGFYGGMTGGDFKDAAEALFGDAASWNVAKSAGNGWPIQFTFHSVGGSVEVLWDGMVLRSWAEFAMDSNLYFVLTHNLKSGQDVELFGIGLDHRCNETVSTVSSTSGTQRCLRPCCQLPFYLRHAPTQNVFDFAMFLRISRRCSRCIG